MNYFLGNLGIVKSYLAVGERDSKKKSASASLTGSMPGFIEFARGPSFYRVFVELCSDNVCVVLTKKQPATTSVSSTCSRRTGHLEMSVTHMNTNDLHQEPHPVVCSSPSAVTFAAAANTGVNNTSCPLCLFVLTPPPPLTHSCFTFWV